MFQHDGAEYWVYADIVLDSVRGGRIDDWCACTGKRVYPEAPIVSSVTNTRNLFVRANDVHAAARVIEEGVKSGVFVVGL